MLQVNRSLEFLDVHLPTPYHDYVGNLREHNSLQSQKLATETKLALLSVTLTRNQAPKVDKDEAEIVLPQCAQSNLDELVSSISWPHQLSRKCTFVRFLTIVTLTQKRKKSFRVAGLYSTFEGATFSFVVTSSNLHISPVNQSCLVLLL